MKGLIVESSTNSTGSFGDCTDWSEFAKLLKEEEGQWDNDFYRRHRTGYKPKDDDGDEYDPRFGYCGRQATELEATDEALSRPLRPERDDDDEDSDEGDNDEEEKVEA